MLLSLLVAVLVQARIDPSVLTPNVAYAASVDYSTTTLKAYAVKVAQDNKLNVEHFVGTVSCESDFMWSATSTTDDFGVVQINAKAHPDISKDEMLNPYWSLDWAANEWKEGRQAEWVCWKLLYGSGFS